MLYIKGKPFESTENFAWTENSVMTKIICFDGKFCASKENALCQRKTLWWQKRKYLHPHIVTKQRKTFCVDEKTIYDNRKRFASIENDVRKQRTLYFNGKLFAPTESSLWWLNLFASMENDVKQQKILLRRRKTLCTDIKTIHGNYKNEKNFALMENYVWRRESLFSTENFSVTKNAVWR